MSPSGSQRAQLGGEGIEVNVRLAAQRPAEDVAHFSLRGLPVSRGASLQPSDQIIVEIAHTQTGHCLIVESFALSACNDGTSVISLQDVAGLKGWRLRAAL
jgi:hypothetical protein